LEMSPDKLWKVVEDKAGLTHDDFKKYYKNSSIGYAIFLKRNVSFNPSIKLEQLRKEWLDFRPPQCYRYLREQEMTLVQAITKHDIFSVLENPKYHQTELLL
ncbi:MAG: hypothetical protein SVX43_03340, partial [Cyanobacteriota bacterium]|nr:hypothetical protein [Cyanobacteriota bacterium]